MIHILMYNRTEGILRIMFPDDEKLGLIDGEYRFKKEYRDELFKI